MRDTSSATELTNILQQAAVLLAQRQTVPAEALLRDALIRWPVQPDLLKYLGSAREQAGDSAGAEAFYRHALAIDPQQFTVATQLGHMLRNQRRYPEAIAAFEAALAVSPNYADAHHGLAVTLHHAGRLDEALAAFDRALALAPGHAGILNNRGLVLGSLGWQEEALNNFNRAVGLQPNFVAALINRGVTLHSLGRFEDALKNYDRALALDSVNAVTLANRGVTLQNLERHQEAADSFEKALELQPGNAEAWSNRAITLHQLKRLEDALDSCDRALALQPEHVQAWNNRGMVLQSLGRLEEAVAAFDRAVAAKPDYAEAWNSRGVLLTDLGRASEALTSFEHVLDLDPGHEGALRNTGLALFESRRIGDGLAAFAKLASRTPLVADDNAPYRQKHDDEQRAYMAEVGLPAIAEGVLYLTASDRLAGPAINPGVAVEAISEEWRRNKPPIVVVDNFLTEEAIAQLRNFCMGSTMWRKTYEDGYLGAMPEEGFAVPLLAQVAEELPATFPEIFKNHALRYLWAFKYDSRLSGTAIHADQAAVNVNFWITPDEANLDPQGGGLIVWDVTAPLDWDFEKFNCDETAMRDFLARSGAKPVVIPYRANRAVIFDSDLFHETDKISFKDGYRNRRINITLLYGRRNA